jgi:hypothetical protein
LCLHRRTVGRRGTLRFTLGTQHIGQVEVV